MDRCDHERVRRRGCGNLVQSRDIDKVHDRERGERWTGVIMRGGCGGEGVVIWCSHVTLTKFTTERGERDGPVCDERVVWRGWQLGAIT